MDLIDFYILNTELIKLRLYLVLKKYQEKEKNVKKNDFMMFGFTIKKNIKENQI